MALQLPPLEGYLHLGMVNALRHVGERGWGGGWGAVRLKTNMHINILGQ